MSDATDDGAGPGSGEGDRNGLRGGVTEAAHLGDERTTLLGVLQRQRDLVAWKLQGVGDEVLRSAGTASGLTLHGLVRHLEDVERSWLREVFAGEQDLDHDWSEQDPEGEFEVPADVSMARLLEDYAAESRRCDAVVDRAADLDAVAATRQYSLRWILLHLVEETARHLGHVDLLREQADGTTGEEPDEPRP